jgi:recombination protein RecT
MANEVQVKKNVGDMVIARVNSLCEAGFNMPSDYSYVNAVKMSMLKLQELKDKNGNSALDVCTPTSIQTALFQMCCKGLNAGLNQCYLLVRGNQLCLQDSYFGKVLMVKRIYPNWNPNPVVIREDDVFEYAIDAATGRKYIVKHEQKIENMDKGFVGAYMYLPTGELYIMTKKQIMQAWSKSSSTQQLTHKQFDEKMCQKTIVNSGCNMIINSTPEYQMVMDEETNMVENKLPDHEDVEEQTYASTTTDFVEVEEESEEALHVTTVKVEDPAKYEETVKEVVKDLTPNDDFDF